jgi:hypothetical protein
LIVVVATIITLFLGVYRATKHEPQFYRQALEVDRTKHAVAGDQLEKNVLDLHNEVRRAGRWEAVFTQSQVNGWLAVDLPEKFGKSVPKTISDPRVRIDERAIHIAARYDDGKVESVVSLVLSAHLTNEPNEIAVRIEKARAGLLPLPLKKFLDKIRASAKSAELDLRWAQADGDPVAIVRLPEEHPEYGGRIVRIDTLELRDGEVYVAGKTSDETAQASVSSRKVIAER